MLKKILLGLVSAFFVLIMACLVIPSFVDWSQYKDQIKTQIEQATGYDLMLGGSLRAAFLPYPHATVENVSINSGTSEGSYAFNATVDQASVSLAILPLLSGQIAVSDVKLVNAVVDVQQRSIGATSEKTTDVKTMQNSQGQAPKVRINSLNLKEAKITYTGLNAAPMVIKIPSLNLRADSLTGPFYFDGSLIYQTYNLSLKGETGAYSNTEAFPVKIAVHENANNLYSIDFSGMADLSDNFGVQGEAKVKTKSIAATIAQINQSPKGMGDQPLTLQGFVTATQKSVKIDNGIVELGRAKGQLNLDMTGVEKNAAKNIMAQVGFSSPVNLDHLLLTGTATKTKGEGFTSEQKSAYAFLPDTIEIPSQMTADISITAPEMTLKGQMIKDTALRVVLKDDVVTAAIAVHGLPGGGSVDLDMAIKSESSSRNDTTGAVLVNPSLHFSGKLDVKSLKAVGVDWLGIVPADMMNKEGMVQAVSGSVKGLMKGSDATLASSALKLDDLLPLDVSLTYKNAAKPSINITLSGDRFIVPKGLIPEQGKTAVDPKAVPVAVPKASVAKENGLQLGLGFDVRLGELVFDDKIMKNLNARGSLHGDALSLSPVTIENFSGTSLNISGTIANIKTLDGLDITAIVDSRNIDPFLKTFNVPLPGSVPQPVGAVKGNVKVQGNNELLDASVKGNVYGFTVDASGQLREPMTKGFMPQSLNVTLSHPNAARAIESLKKDYKSGKGLQKPLTFKSAIISEGDMFKLTNLDITLGEMTATGSVNINTKAKIPSVVAHLNFGTLNTQALLGNDSNTSGENAAISASDSSPWTRDALNTDWIRAMNLKLDAKAVRLVHGSWEILRPTINLDLKEGVLSLGDINGTMFDGTVTISGRVSAKNAGQPLSINASIKAENVNLGSFIQAALGQNKERVRGKGTIELMLDTKGVSSSALAYALNGNGHVRTSNVTVIGIDLGRITQALSDHSLLGGLGSIVDAGFNSGSTVFKPVDHHFQIREGTMPVENFTMQSNTASLVSNGTVSFSRWQMDLINEIKITEPEEMPVVTLGLKGALNAPQKNVQADIIRNYINNKYGAKIQKKLDSSVGGQLLQNFLGLPIHQPQVEQNMSESDEKKGDAETQPQSENTPEKQPSVEEQLLKGLFNKLTR